MPFLDLFNETELEENCKYDDCNIEIKNSAGDVTSWLRLDEINRIQLQATSPGYL